MAFPRPNELVHIPFTEEQEADLRNYLRTEIDAMVSDRGPLVEKWIREIELYEAKPKNEKDFPWPGASNMIVPIIGSMVDTIYPRIYSTIFGVKPLMTVEEKHPNWAQHAKDLQFYLEIVNSVDLKVESIAQSWFLEAIIHGTSVVKLVWDTIETGTKTYNEEGEIESQESEVVKDGPALYRVPLEDFFIPLWANSIAESPIVAHRIRTYWGRLRAQEDSGLYVNLDQIEYSTDWRANDLERARQEQEEAIPSYEDKYEIYECWLDYDYDGDGVDERMVVTFHLETGTILRAQFNPYWHRRKPFREFIYWPRSDRFYGIGIASMIEQIQDEVSTLHNQGIDNRTATNTRMWEVLRGSTADRTFDGTAPGRKIKVDRLGEEIRPLEFASKQDGYSDAENNAVRYAQHRTGVSDFLSGTDMGGGGRETATTTMVKMQEARTRFNWTMDSARQALSDIAQMTLSLLQQFGDDRRLDGLMDEAAADRVAEFLALDQQEVQDRTQVTVTASTASLNKEAEKQNLIALVQLMTQHTLQFEMPLVQLMLNPQAPPPLKEYASSKLKGLRTLFDRILQTFDARNADEILGSLKALDMILSQPPLPPQLPPGGAPPGGAPPGGIQ